MGTLMPGQYRGIMELPQNKDNTRRVVAFELNKCFVSIIPWIDDKDSKFILNNSITIK